MLLLAMHLTAALILSFSDSSTFTLSFLPAAPYIQPPYSQPAETGIHSNIFSTQLAFTNFSLLPLSRNRLSSRTLSAGMPRATDDEAANQPDESTNGG